jgi:hypothetical protein
MQNTTLDLIQQLTPTQTIAIVAAVLALSCVAWMSIRLLGTLARLTLVAAAAGLLISATGLVPALNEHRDNVFGTLGAELGPLWADAHALIEEYTTFETSAEDQDLGLIVNDDQAIQTILSQNDGPNGHP